MLYSMDTRQNFGYDVNGADLSSYAATRPTVQFIPNKLFESLKFEMENSPNSPFSTQFDSETFTTLSDGQEQRSSMDWNSSLESNSSFDRLRPSIGGSSALQNAYSGKNIKDALLELENSLMGPDDDDEEVTTSNPSIEERSQTSLSTDGQKFQTSSQSTGSRYRGSDDGVHMEKRHKGMEEEASSSPNSLKQLLIECARALAENNMDVFEKMTERARAAVSISGEPIQRLGAYLIEGLVAKKEESGGNIYRALRCREPTSNDLLSYMHILYEICPYLKFGYMAANGAIAEACKNEDRIHIIDFQIAQGTQWMTLLQALAARPSGPPHVRITGIDDPVSKYARGASLDAVGKRLAAISEKFNIPIEFHAVPVFAPDITMAMLDVRPNEALAVNFPLQLHHTPDESVDVTNPRDGLLRMIKSLSPKVTTLVEQESNTNTTPFVNRFIETLDYYSAIFESIDVTMPRDRKERISVEQHCLARDIVNIIACEGKERVERHELLGKWKSRFAMAGFKPFPLSSYVNSVIGCLLRCYSEHYTLTEKDGAMLLGWKNRNLVSASAWH